MPPPCHPRTAATAVRQLEHSERSHASPTSPSPEPSAASWALGDAHAAGWLTRHRTAPSPPPAPPAPPQEELQGSLAALTPLRAPDAAVLRAAIFSLLRSRLSAGTLDAAALQGADVAFSLLDAAAPPAAAPPAAAPPKRRRDDEAEGSADGAGGSGGAAKRAAPMLSFGPGDAAAAARLAPEPAGAAIAPEQVWCSLGTFPCLHCFRCFSLFVT